MSDNFQQRLEEKSARVNQALDVFLDHIPNPVPNLHAGLRYGLGLDQPSRFQQGKRVRPVLALEACESLGGHADDAMPFAMAIELMHNFFLVHDDIEDGDEYRRGRPAIWKHYGLAHGINIGDFFYTQVFAAFLSARQDVYSPSLSLDLLRLLVDTLERTHVGQALDIEARHRRDLTIDDYMQIVTNKTGYYLAAPIIGGAIIAGEASVRDAVREFGLCVGPVFQIIDDLLDLTEGKGRDVNGSDIREGKRSFMAIYTGEKADVKDFDRLYDLLDKPREDTNELDIQEVVEIYEKYDALKAARQYCDDLMEKGRKALADQPEGFRDCMLGIFDAMRERKR